MLETNNQILDDEIERLLETSSIAPLLKSILRASLYTMPHANKLAVLESLRKESKKLLILKAKQEKIIEKYRGIMGKLSKNGQS
jgi:hypothetical protein